MPAHSPVYHPREPTDSPLWKILHNRYEDFKAGYDEHCEKQYGFFRPVVDEVVEEYLRCGALHEGFARVRCTNPECKHEYLLAFSCKGRWFCPSCHSKKTIQFGEAVPDTILYSVPHRQFVFSIPIMLRVYFKYDRKLLTQLCHCAKESLNVFFRTVLGLDDGISGMIMVNAFSEQKITYIEDTGKVLYRSAMTHGNNKKNFEIFTAEEFIAAITQHIPDKHFQMVRYGACPELVEGAGIRIEVEGTESRQVF